MSATILVPVDGSLDAPNALELAAELAAPLQARLVVLHVVEPLVDPRDGPFLEPALYPGEHVVAARRSLDRIVRETLVLTDGIEAVVRLGRTAHDAIRREADDLGIDLIVLGAHGDSGATPPALFGETADALTKDPPRPLVIASAPRQPCTGVSETFFAPKHVSFASDGSSASWMGESLADVLADALSVPVQVTRSPRSGEAEHDPVHYPWLVINGERRPLISAVEPARLQTHAAPLGSPRFAS